MIKFDERFSADHDGKQWVLYEKYMGKDAKTKEPKEQQRESYYGTLRQICKKVLDLTAAEEVTNEIASVEDLMCFLSNKEWLLEGDARGYET